MDQRRKYGEGKTMNQEAEKDMQEDVEENNEMYQALADSADNTMNLETENFVRAVENDEYAEYELDDGFVLITNWEGDGMFNPYVVLPDEHHDDEFVDALLNTEAGHFMDFDDVEIVEQNHLTSVHIYNAELTVE